MDKWLSSLPPDRQSWSALFDCQFPTMGTFSITHPCFGLFFFYDTLLHTLDSASWDLLTDKLPMLKSLSQTTSWGLKVGMGAALLSLFCFALFPFAFTGISLFVSLHRSPRCWQWL